MIKQVLAVVIFAAVCLVCILTVGWPVVDQPAPVKYNCDIAEISPDYPVAVKQACRKRKQL